MAMTVPNVMASVPPISQHVGMTKNEIIARFQLSGYGVTKAEKRTNELIMSAQLQTDGSIAENGQLLYWSIMWPDAAINCDMGRVGAIKYEDARHTRLVRLDGKPMLWYLGESEE